MNRWWFRLALLAALAGLGFLLWQRCFPSPERLIRQRLVDLAQTASYGPNQGGLAALVSVNKLLSFFTGDAEVKVEAGEWSRTLSGRDQLREAALSARSVAMSLKVEFRDLHVAVAPDRRTAQVDLAATGKTATDRDPQFYELRFTLQELGGGWLIRRIETIKTLR